MSNEDDNNPFGPFGEAFGMIFQTPDPEELKRQRDRQEMEQDVDSHAVKGFLEGLTLEQLKMLRGMIHSVEHAQRHDMSVGSYYTGLITGVMAYAHNACIACGVNHDQAIEEVLSVSNTQSTAETMHEYNVAPHGLMGVKVHCKSCLAIFKNLEERVALGVTCPNCEKD
jgi:hypothetical protein